MNWWEILLTALGALAGAILVDIFVHIKSSSKKYVEKRKREEEAEHRAIIEDVLKEQLVDIKQDLHSIKAEDLPALKEAVCDSLRNQLLAVYRHCEKLGYRTYEDSQNWEYMYASYIKLGGNTFIIALHDDFNELELRTVQPKVKKSTTVKK